MNTVQNGKGDRPRSNWGSKWYGRYEAIDWHRQEPRRVNDPSVNEDDAVQCTGFLPIKRWGINELEQVLKGHASSMD